MPSPSRQPKRHIRQVEGVCPAHAALLREGGRGHRFDPPSGCVADRIRMVSDRQPDISLSSRHRITAAVDGFGKCILGACLWGGWNSGGRCKRCNLIRRG